VNIETVIGNVNMWFKENCLSLNMENILKNNLKPFYYKRPFIQWMNTSPMCRHPEREYYGKVWHWQTNYYYI
jgi:hypothetical protein